MDKLNSGQILSGSPTVYADSNSVVTAREIRNVNAKSLTYKINIGSDPRSSQTGSAAGQLPQADYTAVDASVICADKICDVTIDGDIDFSVTVKRSQVGAGTGDGALPSSQGPAVIVITEQKVELIECLRADRFILQRVHAKHIVTDSQYLHLKNILQPEEMVIALIDQMIFNGQESCSLFLKVLKEPEVLQTYPQLIQITRQWC